MLGCISHPSRDGLFEDDERVASIYGGDLGVFLILNGERQRDAFWLQGGGESI